METGSKVELINDNFSNCPIFSGESFPIKGVVYIIRNIVYAHDGLEYGMGLQLEEIVNPKIRGIGGNTEICFTAQRFRELIAPEELADELFSHAPETCEE